MNKYFVLIFLFLQVPISAQYGPAITSATSISGAAGSALTYQIQANNSPSLYTVAGLPAGIALDASTGVLSGTLPSSRGSVIVTITATGLNGTATTNIIITSTDVITSTSTVEGATPESLGYNLGHFIITGDAPDWFRYSGVKAARVFISASELQGSTSPGKSKVTSLVTFNSNISATRSAGTASSTYIKWSDYNYNFVSTNGSNEINYKDAFGTLSGLGVDILANITCSPSMFPLAGAIDYSGQWEIWQHYYAQAYLLSRDYNVHRFSMFNEPNNWLGVTEVDWLLRLRVCSDAIQAAITDVNSAFGKSLVTQIYAPNTASGESKYNSISDTWGRDAVVNRHLKLDGTTSPNWWLFNFYNYQKYSMRTNDGSGLTGYIEDSDLLAGYITADMPGETRFPLVLTEFNVRTGASYDASSATQDDLTDSVALGANCVALTQRDANQLYLFKFGQTEDTTSLYGLAKNGTHYVDNISSACNYGGATRAADVYRLFNKAAQGGRSRFASTTSSGAASSSSSGLWRLITQDPVTGNYQIFLANKKTSAIPLSLNVLAWGITDGTPVVVEEVSSTSRGGVSQIASVKDGQIFLGSIPAESVWLVTVPGSGASLTQITATADTQVGDGLNSGIAGGSQTKMQVRADGTVDGRKAVLIKIPVPSGSAASLKSILLDIGIATTAGTSPIQAHVYGLTSDTWSGVTATWSSLSTVLKQGVGVGNQIAQNVALNTGGSPVVKMLGQVLVDSTTSSRCMLDVTDFVKSRTGGYASFLIVQEHRWNYSADLTSVRTTGDTQLAGLVISSSEMTGAGPRLLSVKSGAFSTAPVILTNPSDQVINLGASLNLSVIVDGSGPVSYQWKKDGVPIIGATGPTFTVNPTYLTDAGSYTVQVSNIFGAATSGASIVTVNAAPVLATALMDATVYVGDVVTLTSAFTGSPLPVYQWTKDGVIITNATDSSYSFNASATTESGTYAVTATNIYGNASSSVLVTVNAAPTSFINISNTGFSYSQNFDTLEKSGTYSVKTIGGNVYAPWNDGGAGFTGWYAATDRAFSGYRTVNNSSASDINLPVTTDQSGLMSMGSASSNTDRGFGGIPWSDNDIYQGLRLRNSTGKTLTGCTVAFFVEQFTATTVAKNNTIITFATQAGAGSLKTGTWITQAGYAPLVTNTSSYTRISGALSANRSSKSLTLTGLNVGPGTDLWLRWVVSSTSAEPVALAIDDLVINGVQVVNNPQTISFTLSQTTLTYGDPAPTVAATATSSLPVTVTSSNNSVVMVGPNNILNIIGAGTATLTANQVGDATWAAAPPVQLTLVVSPAGQIISFSMEPLTATVGDANRTLIATSNSDLPVTLTSSIPSVASLNGNILTILGSGITTITATQPGDANYLAALPVAQTLTVSPAGPTFASVFPGQTATSDLDGDGIKALVEYAIGGSSGENDSAKLPRAQIVGSTFTMTVVERINDPVLSISTEVSSNLSFASPITPGPVRSESPDQSGVPTGFKKAIYSMPTSGFQKLFMRLKASLAP